jgi:hypothetical protein
LEIKNLGSLWPNSSAKASPIARSLSASAGSGAVADSAECTGYRIGGSAGGAGAVTVCLGRFSLRPQVQGSEGAEQDHRNQPKEKSFHKRVPSGPALSRKIRVD